MNDFELLYKAYLELRKEIEILKRGDENDIWKPKTLWYLW